MAWTASFTWAATTPRSTTTTGPRPPNLGSGATWLVDAEDRRSIRWDGSEKFHSYVAWLKYIVNRVLVPRGYVMEGRVEWQGEDPKDRGEIRVEGNRVFVCTT
jgi:hypothetical protein